jgi:DNA-binding Lrp family transcriptional regulator
MNEPNRKDKLLIAHLRTDGRMQLTDMSKKTGIPVSTLFDRLKMNDGFITKHTCLLDFSKLGYNTRATIMLRAGNDKQALKEHLQKHPSINNVHRINNGFDFMVEGVFKNVVDVEAFIDKLEGKFSIQDKKTFYVIEDIKREAFMSDPELIL